jgi:hypothetical protein
MKLYNQNIINQSLAKCSTNPGTNIIKVSRTNESHSDVCVIIQVLHSCPIQTCAVHSRLLHCKVHLSHSCYNLTLV